MNPPHPNAFSHNRRKVRPPPRPLDEDERRPTADPRSSERAPDLETPGVRRVLVVEDDPTFAKLLTRYLKASKEHSYRSTVTGSIREALDRLEEDAYDVILADLGLPDSAEYDTIDSLTSAAPGVPIVVLTGTAQDGIGSSLEAVRRGASYFLRKGSLDAAAVERGIHYATERKSLSELLEDPDGDTVRS